MAGETELTETRVGNEMAIWLWLTDNHFVIYLSNKINIRRVCTLSQLSPDQARPAQNRTEQNRTGQSRAARQLVEHLQCGRTQRVLEECGSFGVKWGPSGVVAHICAVAVAVAVAMAVALSASECTQRKECATQVWFDLMNERNFLNATIIKRKPTTASMIMLTYIEIHT